MLIFMPMIYILLRFLPIVLFAVFLLWLFLRKREGRAGEVTRRQWFWALVAALGITVLALLIWAVTQPANDSGSYKPATLENGKITR